MISTKLPIKTLLLSLLLINSLVYCMEKKDTEISQFDEQDLSPIETLPNELLLLIFYSKIDGIINTHNATEGKEEFKTFLSTLRLINRSFYSFIDELKRYFVTHKKLEVSDVVLKINTKPAILSFKVGSEIYTAEADNDTINKNFAKKISVLDNGILKQIGEAIVQQIKTIGNAEEERLALQLIFSEVLYEPYYHAEEVGNTIAMDKLKEIVKPIFKAYPAKHNSIYTNNLNEYHFDEASKMELGV